MTPFAPPTPADTWLSDSSEVLRIQKKGKSETTMTITTPR
jgi:hypothetical protein